MRTKIDKWGIEHPVYVFNEHQAAAIRKAIGTLAIRMLRTIPRFEPSQEAIIRLISPEEDIPVLLNARKVINLDSYDAKSTSFMQLAPQHGVDSAVAFSFSNVVKSTPMMPRDPRFQLLHNSNVQVYEEMIGYIQKRIEVAIDFGRVVATFEALNRYCSTPAQMRYMWPAILPILSMNSELEGFRQAVATFRVPSKTPSLPVEVRAACKTTAATITMAGLLPPMEDDAMPTPDVVLDIRLSGSYLDEGGFKFVPHSF